MIGEFDAIADGLADRGFAVEDQFLSQTEVEDLLALNVFSLDHGNLKLAGIGKGSRQINESIRGDMIHWVDQKSAAPPLMNYLNKIHRLRQFLNEALFLSLKDFELHTTVYPPGSYYKRHIDQFRNDDHRKLSLICYLNHAWKIDHGGQLRIYFSDGTHQDFLPMAGRLICFRSDQLEHEVLPATRSRMSLTGWMLDQMAELKHLS